MEVADEVECNGGDTSYHFHDFEWEDLKNEIETKMKLELDSLIQHQNVLNHAQPEQEEEIDPSRSSNAEAWQKFHERHSAGTFFKERKYLLKEFPELLKADGSSKLLEVGCGNGSTVLPIMRQDSDIVVYACDCSVVALERAQEMVDIATGLSGAHRFKPFCCDFSIEAFPSWLCCTTCREFQPKEQDNSEDKVIECPGSNHLGAGDVVVQGHDPTAFRGVNVKEIADFCLKQCCIGGVDFVTMIFTLSSVPIKRMPHVIKECLSILKPGGMLLFRDYGLYDMTMLRFTPAQKISDFSYIRGDGTFSYYFSLNFLRELFKTAGFVEIESRFCCVQLVNRRKGQKMRRVWVHGKFQKPPT